MSHIERQIVRNTYMLYPKMWLNFLLVWAGPWEYRVFSRRPRNLYVLILVFFLLRRFEAGLVSSIDVLVKDYIFKPVLFCCILLTSLYCLMSMAACF
jgi:hypothetical protein